MSSAVIFGGCGFIGLYYAEELINQKSYDKIYLVDIKEPEDDFGKSKYKNILATGKVNFLKKDIRENLNDLDINESVNIILNFAAVHREPGHLDHEYFDTNLKGAENICSFSNHHKCNNIIFLSSIAVYGAGDHEKNEETKKLPNTAYGKSKLSAEKIHILWQNADKENRILSICRSGVIFGPGEKGNVARLVSIIKKKLFFFMGNKNIKKAGIYIKELLNILIWVNQKQLSKKIPNIALYNATLFPCPTLEDYSKSISKNLDYSDNFFSIPYFFINSLIILSSFITKNLSSKNNYNYTRLKKLFRSNAIKPSFLLNKKYTFKYDLNSSMEDWKKMNPSDW